MTSLSLTSGQILDIISALEAKEDFHYDSGDHQLAVYYMEMVNQFHRVHDRLKELPGEQREANLILAAN